MAKKTAPLPDFESALAELEKIVEKMEAGDQTLEQALASFQRGVELTRVCQQGLREAEQRVEQLLEQSGMDEADREVAPPVKPSGSD